MHSRPDGAENADGVATEDLNDLRVGVAAPNQSFSQIEHAFRVIETADRDRAIAILVILIA